MDELKQYRVLVTPTSFGKNDPTMKPFLEEKVGEVIYNTSGKPLTSQELRPLLADIDGIIAGLDEFDTEALRHANHLKVISRYGVGLNNVDLEFAEHNSIMVTYTPGANSTSVADLTVLFILLLCRPVCLASEKTRQGEWPRISGLGLEGKIVGLYGFGAIGKEVCKRLAGFGCRLLAYDVIPDEKTAKELCVTLVNKDDLLSQSDFLSLHVPVVSSNHNMVNAEFIQRMKQNAFLINTARGELVDEDALGAAIQSGHLAGAALDTFKEEPLKQDNALLKLPQVIITPHMAAHTDSAINAMGWMSVNDCLAVLKGEAPKFPVIRKGSV
ncbi:MAG: phosphoglycerate dehydrogenase [Anaerolineaceae bacterium]|nr:phosphoglycerate dehydrogenase [Anaerolineaceae bacterium]